MTIDEFRQKVKKGTTLDKYWYYILCVAIIILSFVLFFYLITQPEKFKGPKVYYYLITLFLLCFGLSGFYYLPNRYKVVTVQSNLPLSKKQDVIARVMFEIAEIPVAQPSQYTSFNLKRKWWQSKYVVRLFYDEQGFSFSLQGHDHDGGFLDLGETERKRKKLIAKIRESL